MRLKAKVDVFCIRSSQCTSCKYSAVFVRQQAGDEITLVKKIDDGWYIGRLGDQEGMFPVKFVEIIEDLPQETAPETQVYFTEFSSLLTF